MQRTTIHCRPASLCDHNRRVSCIAALDVGKLASRNLHQRQVVSANPPIRQPNPATANTVSSLGFVFSGALMFLHINAPTQAACRQLFLHDGHRLHHHRVGSAFYHASLTFIGQFFDVFGMFLLASSCLSTPSSGSGTCASLRPSACF
jgi:hypothetical protein